jgi:hypothetical protein
MKTQLVFLLSLMISVNVWAGTSTSGGGIGVLCKAQSQSKLQILDLYEAAQAGIDLIPSISFESDYTVGLTRLRALAGDPRPVTKTDFQEFTSMFQKYSEFTQDEIAPSMDAGPTVALPANCHYEQIAIYHDGNDPKLIINANLWAQLDSLNQVALLMHEAVYQMQRTAFYNNSHQVRRLVRELYSKNGPSLKGAQEGLKKGQGHMCFAGDTGTNSSFTFVWQGHEIYLLNLAGEARIVKTTINVPVSFDEIQLQRVEIGNSEIGYKVTDTPTAIEIKVQTIDSELPIPHITWRQTVKTGEILTVGMNVNGRTLDYPVTSCFPY